MHRNGKLTFKQFCNLFLPQSDLILLQLLTRRSPTTQDFTLSDQSFEVFQKLLLTHLAEELNHEKLRKDLFEYLHSKGWTTDDTFNLADQDFKGFISILDFQVLLLKDPKVSSFLQHLDYLLRLYENDETRRTDRVSFTRNLTPRLQ